MPPHSNRSRGSALGSAVLAGLLAALISVVTLKFMLGLTFAASLVVAILAFILGASVALRRSTMARE